ncbi:MAG: efflux RND transporter periplasmic adaptor subunit [Clostridia bacterium]|nr:efflux RND transporter periplasmic adaptor subunit [Clostridia bacterium]
MIKLAKLNIKKKTLIAVMVLIIVGISATGYYVTAREEVILADVSFRDVFRFVEETGTVESESAVTVIAKGSGTVSKILVEEGQSVEVGDLLLSLSDFSSASDVAGIKAQTEGVYAQYVIAKRLSDSNRILYDQGAVSYLDYAASLAATQQLSAQLASLGYSAESVIDATAANGIKAPISGIVTVIYVKEGEVAGSGLPIVEIGGLDDRMISLHLISKDADLVSQGMAASVYAEGEFITDQALVHKISIKATDYISLLGIVQKRVAVTVRLPKEAMLRLGSNADVKIVVEERKHTLALPSKSIFSIEDEEYVYVENGGRAILTKIKVGLEGDTYTEVLEGLSEGQRVVVSPPTDIGDGTRIKEKP